MLRSEDYKHMLVERRENGVAVLTLNRPDILNATNGTLHSELSRFSLDFANDRELRVLIITGAGRAFCAGGDFSPDDPVGSHGPDMWTEARQIVDHILECEKPIISAVNGYAMGLGATVALLADVVVVSSKSVIADTHVNMALGAGDGGQLIWPHLMGVNRAKYYLMSCDRVTGKEAVELGLASFYVEEPDDLLPKALEIADGLAAKAPQAVAASKAAVNAYLRSVAATVMPIGLRYEQQTMNSKDHQEAIAAFQEKREPKFSGE